MTAAPASRHHSIDYPKSPDSAKFGKCRRPAAIPLPEAAVLGRGKPVRSRHNENMVDIDFPLVPDANEQYLNEKQRMDYEAQRRDFVEWLLAIGKDPSMAEGYSESSVKRTAYRCGKLDRFVWEDEGYTYPLSRDHADEYMKHLVYEDYSNAHRANTLDALKRYFKWLHHERGGELYDPDMTFLKNGSVQPPEFLSVAERKAIREAALEYGTIPAYNGLTTEERENWKLRTRCGSPECSHPLALRRYSQ